MTAEWPWAFDAEHICMAPLLMMDDHWGAIRQTCDLISGHKGEHAAQLRSCVPEAVLCWPQNDLHTPESAPGEIGRSGGSDE